MIILNHECYVSLEVAKLLREAGFNWKCEHPYFNGVFDSDSYEPDNFLDTTYQIAAPTLDVAQRWLRQIKDVEMYVIPFRHPEYDRTFYHVSICNVFGNIDEYPNSTMGTYEEEQEAGIKKALELILEK